MRTWLRLFLIVATLAVGIVRAAAQGAASQFAIEGTITDPDGQPVAGASIVVGPLPWPSGNGTSDAKGHYQVGWSGQDVPYAVVVRVPEKNWSVLRQLDRNTSHLDLKLEPAWRLKVTVQDKDGKPIEGATAVISYNPKAGGEANAFALNYSPPATTDKDGKFDFGGMPVGQPYYIRVQASGYGGSARAVQPNLAASTEDQSLTFTLLKAGESVASASFARPLQSGARGVAVSVGAAAVQADAGQSSTLEGTIRGPDGAPIGGASVSVRPMQANATDVYSDVNGHYSLNWTAPSADQNFQYSLYVQSDSKNLAALTPIDPGATHLDAKLQPELTLSAKAVDAAGKGIPNASTLLLAQVGNVSFVLNSTQQRQVTDAQGHVEITGLAQGHDYTLRLFATNYGMAIARVDASQTMTTRYDFPDTVLPLANLKLAGKVLDQDGNPAANFPVRVLAVQGQPQGLVTRTDSNGHFEFDAVCAGPVTLTANAGLRGRGAGAGPPPTVTGRGQVRANGGDTNVVIRLNNPNNNNVVTYSGQPQNLPNSMTVTGKVTDSTGAPVAGAYVYICPNIVNNMNQVGDATTDADGHYSLVIRQPQYTFQQFQNANMNMQPPQIIARSEQRNLAAAQPIYSTNTTVDLVLAPGMEMSGSVTDDKGVPLTSANVQIMIRGGFTYRQLGPMQGATVDNHGAFSMNALPPGDDLLVQASCPGYGQANTTTPAGASQSTSIKLPPIVLKLADQRLEGKVVDQNGKPYPNARVQIYGQGQPQTSQPADQNGHFAFKVCEGIVQLYAYPMNGGGFNIQQVQAHSGDLNVVLTIGPNQQPQGVVNRVGRQAPPRFSSLRPRDWSWAAISLWPGEHPKVLAVMLTVQIMAVLGTASGILWTVRRR